MISKQAITSKNRLSKIKHKTNDSKFYAQVGFIVLRFRFGESTFA